jgi:hypothetical protein
LSGRRATGEVLLGVGDSFCEGIRRPSRCDNNGERAALRAKRRLHCRQVILYLVDENDLFPEDEVGALGLVDDVYLVYACLAAMRSVFPALSLPSGYSAPDARLVTTVRSLLPPGVADALDRTRENLVRVAATLYSPGTQTTPGPPAQRAKLRVGEAVASLSSKA